MKERLTLGSLFDGIGGFPLAGIYAGMQPLWASEIEPFPIRVTSKRLPSIEHLGDIHAIKGGEIAPVDVITFGSPCQNLSVAGKRTGLAGEQSSLFFEAVRVITEMREATNETKPRWVVWENVPGALSSMGGRDYRAVLESLIQIKSPEAVIPMPERSKWLPAGEIMGNDHSLAWRILDAAKGWGVAQRRRRVFVVVDLDGQRAGQILFESEGLSGYSPPRGKAWQGAAGNASESVGVSGGSGKNDVAFLSSKAYGISSDQSNAMLSGNPHSGIYEADTSWTLDCSGGNPACNQGGIAILAPSCAAFMGGQGVKAGGLGYQEEISPTIKATPSGGNTVPDVVYALQGSMIGRKNENGPQGDGINENVCFTLNTIDRPAVTAPCADVRPCYSMDRAAYNQGQNALFGISIEEERTQTLVAQGPNAVAQPMNQTEYLVRRLTPGECCRLQGYPDGWCENLGTMEPTDTEINRWLDIFEAWREALGKSSRPRSKNQIIKWLHDPYTDAAAYKAYGNSVAVPCVFFVLAGIAWAAETEETE